MHELLRVWTERKGLILIAASALIYAFVLIPFNQLQWNIGGIAIRPAAALPVVLGIIWGPAAAWGLGIGNIAGDLFGSWSPLSIFGFLINVLYPYLSYLLWHRMTKGHEIRADPFSISRYLAVTFFVTLVCTVLLALAGTIFFARPFESRFISYFGNNIIWAMTLGTVIFWLVLEKAVRKRFVYGREWVRQGIAAEDPGVPASRGH
jgi:energy-coupling factor transport system substrate-specific component